MKSFAAIGALIAFGSLDSAAADLICTPTPTEYKIAMCSSQCNSNFCGYSLPLLGKKTEAAGNFITYHMTGDLNGIGTVTIPVGMTEGRVGMRFSADKHTAVQVSVDEIPDYSIHVQVRREGGDTLYESIAAPNETFTFELPDDGVYILAVIHSAGAPGGRSVQFIPTVSLLPSVKQDTAGNSKAAAKDLGPLVKDGRISGEEFLQRVAARSDDGNLKGGDLVHDNVDWFKFTTATAGRIKAEFKNKPLLQSNDISVVFGLADAGGPSPIPETGIEIEAGTHYLAAKAVEGVVVREFGHHYTFAVTFEPK
jgi:hypothetical protein